MSENITNESDLNIPVVDAASKFDATKYINAKVRIAKVTRGTKINFYPDGKTYKADSTETMPIIEVATEVLEVLTMKDGTKKDIVVTARFNLQENENPDGTKSIVISKNPKARLWKFMRLVGANTLEELKGKFVKLIGVPSKDPEDDRMFLRIYQGE